MFVIDAEWLSEKSCDNPNDIQYRNPWKMTAGMDYFSFQYSALLFVLKNGLDVFGDGGLYYYIDERGEPHQMGAEWAITCDPSYYYEHLISKEWLKLYPRDSVEQIGESVISEEGICAMSQTGQMLAEHKTKYKLVISPCYNQLKLNPRDKEILDSIFGYENVYDYSGINQYTNDTLNYYENSHYRPKVAIA